MDSKEEDCNTRRRKNINFIKDQAAHQVAEDVKPGKTERGLSKSVKFDLGSGGHSDYGHYDEFEEEMKTGVSKQSLSPDRRNQLSRNEHSAMDHFQNGLWVISAVLLFSYLDVPKVITQDHRVKQPVFLAALVCTAGFFVVAAFHVIYLSWIKHVEEKDWATVFPLGVPLATIAAVSSGLLYVIAFWNIWSIFTPIILFAFTMPMVILLSYL